MFRKSKSTNLLSITDADSKAYAQAFRNFAIVTGITLGITTLTAVGIVHKIRTHEDPK